MCVRVYVCVQVCAPVSSTASIPPAHLPSPINSVPEAPSHLSAAWPDQVHPTLTQALRQPLQDNLLV